MLAPISWRTPPRHYGPWEWIVSLLTEGLVNKGCDVTLYATGDSVTAANHRWTVPRPYSEDSEVDAKVAEYLHISNVFEEAQRYDIIHNNFDFMPLSYSNLVQTPLLTTIHGFSSAKIVPVYCKYNRNTYYISISNADRHPELDYEATIYHGIPVNEYPFSANKGDYLLFLGRIHHDKGAKEAIALAQQTRIPLVIAGIVQDECYYQQFVAPHMDGNLINFMGTVSDETKKQLLAGAKALLHLINFNEPFGLTVIEAMACGTPVIAMDRGSMPEIIRSGETGFLINGLEDGQRSIEQLNALSRNRCREWVEERFSVDTMVNNYQKVYQKILDRR